jgi:hypothetical protein
MSGTYDTEQGVPLVNWPSLAAAAHAPQLDLESYRKG